MSGGNDCGAPGAVSILIVDDAPDDLAIVADHLARRGFRARVATSGEQALEHARASPPALILLDARMPGMDGFETCRRLKADTRTREIPVVFMTAANDVDDMVEGFAAGGVDCLTKPLRIGEMAARINVHLTMRAMHVALAESNRRLRDEVAVREQAERELSRTRDELEARVARRTRELARANADLRAQIVERERTEAKLKLSEARQRMIVEASPVPLGITALRERRILYTNESLRELFGMSEHEQAQLDPSTLYVDGDARERTIAAIVRDGVVANAEVHFRRLDGSRFWAIVTGRVGTYEHEPAIYWGFYDVSARKQAEERLRASEASLANAQRLARIGDWKWDSANGVTHVSDETRIILGLNASDIGWAGFRAYLAAVHAEDRAAVRRAMRRALLRGAAQAVDHRVRAADGGMRIVQVRAQVVGRRRGGPIEVVGTIQDVTERKRIEQALVESREQLRELGAYMEAVREEERKRIALEIHDELGQLLTALKMDVALVKMRLAESPELLTKVTDMRELVERTILMVRNVTNHLRPAALNFGLASALEWLAEDFSKRTGMPCQFLMNAGEPILCDTHATAVFRVVQESLTNVARHARATRVHVSVTRGDHGYELHVSDNGCGFDPAAPRKRDAYGLLGMSERARLIGASLQVDSAPGAGTVVSISIPIHHGEQG